MRVVSSKKLSQRIIGCASQCFTAALIIINIKKHLHYSENEVVNVVKTVAAPMLL